MTKNSPRDTIEQCLIKSLEPSHLEVIDESDDHLGHAEAGNGGHYRVIITAAKFAGLSSLDRHRLIFQAIGNLEKQGIHALAIEASDS